MTIKFEKRDIELDIVLVNEIKFQIKKIFDLTRKNLIFWPSEPPSPTKIQNLTNSFN